MTNDDYVVIQGWMINELKLKGAELLCYATIYAFSKAEGHTFHGSQQYIADWCGVSRRTANEVVNNLIDKQLIERFTEAKNGEIVYHYIAKNNGEKKLHTPCEETSHNNNIEKNKEENKKDKSFLSKKEDADFFDSLLSIGIVEDVATEWMHLRKKSKATNSIRSFNLVNRAIDEVTKRLNISPTNVIEICLARGWHGCQTSYFDNIKLSDFGMSQQNTAQNNTLSKRYDSQGNVIKETIWQ